MSQWALLLRTAVVLAQRNVPQTQTGLFSNIWLKCSLLLRPFLPWQSFKTWKLELISLVGACCYVLSFFGKGYDMWLTIYPWDVRIIVQPLQIMLTPIKTVCMHDCTYVRWISSKCLELYGWYLSFSFCFIPENVLDIGIKLKCLNDKNVCKFIICNITVTEKNHSFSQEAWVLGILQEYCYFCLFDIFHMARAIVIVLKHISVDYMTKGNV